jgi:hypothetical protein
LHRQLYTEKRALERKKERKKETFESLRQDNKRVIVETVIYTKREWPRVKKIQEELQVQHKHHQGLQLHSHLVHPWTPFSLVALVLALDP